MLHVSVAQFEIKHGAKCVPSISGKSTGIEIYFTYQVGIKDSHRTAGCSLRAEVIDIGYFHSVQIETVFRRRPTAYNQVIAVADRREGNSRIRLNNTRNVSIGSRTLFYLLQSDDAQADRTFQVAPERRSGDGYSCEFGQVLFHFYRNVQIFGR